MTRRPALALAVPLLLLAGCGGSSPAADPGLPKDEYVRQAEALCTTTTADLDKLDAETPNDPQGAINSLDLLTARFEKGVGDVTTLTAKQPDKAELDRIFLDPARAQVTAINAYKGQLREAIAKGPEAITALPDPPEPTPAPDLAAMRTYGLTACADLADST